MDTQLAVQEYRIKQWNAKISMCRNSRMTVGAEENGINLKSYYYWIQNIRAIAVVKESTSPQFVRVETESAIPGCSSGIMLRVSGCELELAEDTSDVLIERTLQAIRNVW